MRTICLTSIFLVLAAITRAADPFNYANYWASLPNIARVNYVEGVSDGVNHAYFESAESWLSKDELFTSPVSDRVERVRKKVFLMLSTDSLVPVMTHLYQDPANGFLRPHVVLFLARDKLLGEKIEDALVAARKQAIENHEALQKAKSR